ncbi:MAG: hypothetical protein CVT98_04020 [Bacteroidetes bacterium HGW-Bacteroidetes-15]|nr:MAG: hypothetical protein CVT98_04020 [Bacteroidetes bacterium HGW-Bacteroidetes-15]
MIIIVWAFPCGPGYHYSRPEKNGSAQTNRSILNAFNLKYIIHNSKYKSCGLIFKAVENNVSPTTPDLI